jgi:hypothetical protein
MKGAVDPEDKELILAALTLQGDYIPGLPRRRRFGAKSRANSFPQSFLYPIYRNFHTPAKILKALLTELRKGVWTEADEVLAQPCPGQLWRVFTGGRSRRLSFHGSEQYAFDGLAAGPRH